MNTIDRSFSGVLWFAAGMATAFVLVHAFGSAVATVPREQTARTVPPSGPSSSTHGTAARDRWMTVDQIIAELYPTALPAAAHEDGGPA